MIERRAENRTFDVELIMLGWEEETGCRQQLANVLDVSSCGICLVADYPLPAGTRVTMTYGEGELTGIVRNAVQAEDVCRMGIEFLGDSRDSTLHFQPELLLREE